MTDKAAALQIDAGPAGRVLNLYRLRPGADEPSESFTPRSLAEHAHSTLQVSVLLRDTVAAVGWQTGGGTTAGRRLRGGQAYVVPPDQPHDFRLHRAEGMVNFHIDPAALAALHPVRFEASGVLPAELRVVADPVAAALAGCVHAAAMAPGGLEPLHLDAAWTMLALHIARTLHPADDRRRDAARLPSGRLRRVLDHVDAHLGDGTLRVADLAGVAGLSAVHFTRLFARAVGASPMQFVIGRRLERGLELLRADMAVAEVAMTVGFGSHARFGEAFRRRFGVTPTDARRKPDTWRHLEDAAG